MRKRRLLLILAIGTCFLATIGCKNKSRQIESVQEFASEKESIKIRRFDKLLFETNIYGLKDTLLKHEEEYRFLFNAPLTDTIYISEIIGFATDTVLKDVYNSVKKEFNDLSWLETQLNQSFTKTKKYFPETTIPIFYTLISGSYDYYDRVIITDEFVAISLDFYVAKKFEKYAYFGLTQYMLNFLDSANILSDCMYAWGSNILPEQLERSSLLDIMIYQGKILYYLDMVIPEVSDELKIRYTPEQLQWCKKNEGLIWGFFIQQKLLYEKDFLKIRSFINEGPKTQNFEGSPARLADYIGWQIVKDYMRNTNTSLRDLFNNANSQQILTESGYKPKRK